MMTKKKIVISKYRRRDILSTYTFVMSVGGKRREKKRQPTTIFLFFLLRTKQKFSDPTDKYIDHYYTHANISITIK